jgi:hypothetical protein
VTLPFSRYLIGFNIIHLWLIVYLCIVSSRTNTERVNGVVRRCSITPVSHILHFLGTYSHFLPLFERGAQALLYDGGEVTTSDSLAFSDPNPPTLHQPLI